MTRREEEGGGRETRREERYSRPKVTRREEEGGGRETRREERCSRPKMTSISCSTSKFQLLNMPSDSSYLKSLVRKLSDKKERERERERFFNGSQKFVIPGKLQRTLLSLLQVNMGVGVSYILAQFRRSPPLLSCTGVRGQQRELVIQRTLGMMGENALKCMYSGIENIPCREGRAGCLLYQTDQCSL